MSGPVTACRACGGTLSLTMADLGRQPPSNAFLAADAPLEGERLYPLRAVVCDSCRLVQLDYDVDPRELFGNYVYFSSYSDDWLRHAAGYCRMAMQRFSLGSDSLVVELASNDGYLLKNFVAAGVPVLGIDPSDTVARAAEAAGVPTLVEFFGEAQARKLVAQGRSADLLIGNNVLAHVPAINDFVAGIAVILKPTGTVTIEFPHLLKLIEHVEFDTIYHEHFSYISLLAIERVFRRHGLRIHDVEELPTHGGSLRIYASHAARSDLADSETLVRVRAAEAAAGLAEAPVYQRFAARVDACREALRQFLRDAKSSGRTVIGYGAAAKGNTLLNFCGVTATDLVCVADRNPHKQGKLLPGSRIPVISPEELLRRQPDYVLILPWNLRAEIMLQLTAVRGWGGRFVTPVPEVQIHP